MDGIHDMGGMHGFGKVEPEDNEPVFHGEWEARMFALASAVPYAVPFGDDQFRPGIERMDPAHYLASSYYEKWFESILYQLGQKGLVDAGELAGGAPNPLPDRYRNRVPLKPERVEDAIHAGDSQEIADQNEAPRRFDVGDKVHTQTVMPNGHTRLPRYARGRIGHIERVAGVFLLADENYRRVKKPETLYTVVFTAEELWGEEGKPGDTLSLDLWDSYLNPAPS